MKSKSVQKSRVLVVGHDEHAAFVCSSIEELGGRVVVLDSSTVPSLTVESRGVFVDGARVDVSAVYLKSIATVAHPFASESEQMRAERERRALLESALIELEQRVPVVNPLDTLALHMNKPRTLALLERNDVAVPAWCATTEPSAARTFVETQRRRGDVVYKPLSGGAETRLFVDDDLDRLDALTACPALFQRRIEGDELRVYVLDRKVVGAFRVPTDDVVDARRNVTRATACEAPSVARAIAVRAHRACDLVFSAIDLRIHKSKAWVLDVNPTPAISFYDARVDGPVVTALARFLMRS